MTVYRTGTDSVLMEHLIRAAQKGKEVTVVVELMARFDEEANIGWAAQLERSAPTWWRGVVGYKTHAKMLLVVRREERRAAPLRPPGHRQLPPRTTALYTDFGLLTANEEIGADVAEVFKQLTGLEARPASSPPVAGALHAAAQRGRGDPREAEIARAGRKRAASSSR